MIHTALASAALLGESSETVLKTAFDAGVNGVEWSADGFLEPGNMAEAGNLMMNTLHAGLCSVSYASLYRFGIHDPVNFNKVLETTATLHAPMVRVWTGPKEISACLLDNEGRARNEFADGILKQADKAGELGISLCFGFAKGSILDNYESAIRLFSSLKHPFVKLVWEILGRSDFDTARQAFETLSGQIGMVIVRSSECQNCAGSLPEQAEDWLEYLDAFDEQGGSPDMVRHVLIRSFKTDDTSMLTKDAYHLAKWSRLLRRYHRRRIY